MDGGCGKCGSAGDSGLDGPIGDAGYAGNPGQDAQDGEEGETGPQGIAQPIGITFARHSQASKSPNCPAGTKQIWTGFSLMHTVGNGLAHSQDLGDVGSCMKKFTTMYSLQNDDNLHV